MILPGKEKVVAELKKAAQADNIYLATDLDREGRPSLGISKRPSVVRYKYQRVTFSEITKSAVEAAFNRPSMVNIDRVNAQQARRFLDRVVGYMLSPLLWAKIARGSSRGAYSRSLFVWLSNASVPFAHLSLKNTGKSLWI